MIVELPPAQLARLFMRSVALAVLFSVAVTGALASDGKPAVLATETAHPAGSIPRPALGPQATRPADTRLAAAPASTAADPVLMAAAPLKAATSQEGPGAQAKVPAQGATAAKMPPQAQAVGQEDHVSRGGLTVAALLMMAVVMIRRSGASRML